MHRHLIALGVAVMIGAVLFVPDSVSAHTLQAAGTCEGGVVWNASQYDANQTNSIVVTIDGTVVYSDPSFGSTDQGQRTPDKTMPHAWSVKTDAPGIQFDFTRSGSYQACQTPPTTTLAPTTTSSSTTTTTMPVTTSTSSIPAETTTVPESPSTSSPATSTEPSTSTSTLASTVPSPSTTPETTQPPSSTAGPTTIATCTDIRTHEQTTDASRCVLPPTGSSGVILPLAAAVLLLGMLAVLAARRRV